MKQETGEKGNSTGKAKEQNNIKVSVVMPIYNAQEYLEQSLDSVLQQTLQEIEIICVDDGSTDGTQEILCAFQQKDSRIKVLRQENKYAGAARNLGLEHASGKYVIFWDADDLFETTVLEKLFERAESVEAQICICNAKRYDNRSGKTLPSRLYLDMKYVPEKDVFSRKDIPGFIFNISSNVPWNKLFLREFILDHKLRFQPLRQANDVYFVMIAMYRAERITVWNEPLISYRWANEKSLTGKVTDTKFCSFDAFWSVLEELQKDPQFDSTLRQSFDNKAVGPLLTALRTQKSSRDYAEVYRAYREELFPRLGLFDREETYFYKARHFQDLDKMKQCEYEEFLLYQAQDLEYRLIVKGGLHEKEKSRRQKCEERIEKEKQKNEVLKNTTAYKVGYVITWIPAKIKRILKKKM